MQSTSTLGEFLRLLGDQLLCALMAEFSLDARASFFECRSARWLRVSDLKDGVTLRGARQLGSGFRLHREGGLHEVRRRADPRQAVILAEVIAGDDLKMVIGSGLLETASPRLRVSGVGFVLGGLPLLLAFDNGSHLRLYFVKGSDVRCLFLDQLNDVIAVGGLDQIAELTLLGERKGGFIEFWHHAAVLEPA